MQAQGTKAPTRAVWPWVKCPEFAFVNPGSTREGAQCHADLTAVPRGRVGDDEGTTALPQPAAIIAKRTRTRPKARRVRLATHGIPTRPNRARSRARLAWVVVLVYVCGCVGRPTDPKLIRDRLKRIAGDHAEVEAFNYDPARVAAFRGLVELERRVVTWESHAWGFWATVVYSFVPGGRRALQDVVRNIQQYDTLVVGSTSPVKEEFRGLAHLVRQGEPEFVAFEELRSGAQTWFFLLGMLFSAGLLIRRQLMKARAG